MLSMFLGIAVERPLYAYVAKHNIASIRVLEKCGFAPCEKTMPSFVELSDGVEDLAYAIDLV